MKRTLKAIGTIGTLIILLLTAYLLGTTKAETITEVQTVEKIVEIVPNGYIKLSDCIPLDDIACYYLNDGYICFELTDVGNQLDDTNNKSYTDIIKGLEDKTEEFYNNYIDMRQVTDFETSENGLYLYLDDGSGYYWER